MRFRADSAPEVVVFNGVRYRRMGGHRNYYLSQSASNAGRKNPKGLHVAIWEFHSGLSVPKGWEVNHIDGDVFNFEFSNLECLPEGVHRALPKRVTEKSLGHLEAIRPLAASWHKSREGREWHRQNARKLHAAGKYKNKVVSIKGQRRCIWCGDAFEFRTSRRLFCSTKCQFQEDGYRKGKYKFVNSYYAARPESERRIPELLFRQQDAGP